MERTKFAGVYTDDGAGTIVVRYSWEQRKFSELYARSSEKNDGSIGMDKNITVATMQFKNDVKVSTTEYLKTYYTFKLGDIAFEGHQSKEFRYGRFVENDIGNGIVSHIFAVFRPIQEYDLCFWKYAINNETLMQRILARSTKASTMMHDLVTNDFLKETFLVPSVKEQKQIGAFLNKLDHLITLHQRKYDMLQKVKKSMLEKMFPKNGSKVPEIRFAGFTDDWEQRKLRDLVKEIKRNDPNSSAPIMMITANDGFINQSERYSTDNAGKSLQKYILLQRGELAYNHGASKLRPYGSCFALIDEENARIPYVYHCFSCGNENPEFLSLVLNSKAVEQQLRRLVSSGARMDGLLNISFDDYTSIPIMIPNRNEQKQIADYIHTLNGLITLHQRKLEKLKKLKKSMLEEMFV